MKIILAVICFLAMIVHGLFGYYLFINGEAVFEPDNMIVALHPKSYSMRSLLKPSNLRKYLSRWVVSELHRILAALLCTEVCSTQSNQSKI